MMELAKLLLPVQDRPDMESIAKMAFVLADRFGAAVEGLYAYTPPRDQIQLYYEAAGPVFHESLLKEAEQRSEKALKQAEALFTKLAEPYAGVTSSFRSMEGDVPTCVGQRGRLADLTVIGRAGDDADDPWLDIRDAAIFQTARPVIVAPDAPVSAELGKTVVIAWKDSVEAARAIAAAGPFLATAKTVHLVSVGNDAVSIDDLKEAQAYVTLHAENVKAAIVDAGEHNTAELLLEEAGKHPDALLVMGAYSHWRWKELAFGGVTEYVLRMATVPILMAH